MKVHTDATMHSITLKKALLFTLGIAVMGLIGYNMRDRILGTPLKVITVADGTTVDSPFLPITGTARHARTLSINGRSVTIDREGLFRDEVVLSPGYNIVEVALTDQFGGKKIKTYQIVVTPPQAVATADSTPYQ